MLLVGILGFQTLLLPFVVVFVFWMQHKWRNAVSKKEEIMRLVDIVSKDSAMDEVEAISEYYAFPKPRQCAICFCPTTTRCSRCKSVHYCSSKCQIIHWRQGHKDECRLAAAALQVKQGDESFASTASDKHFKIHDEVEQLVSASPSVKLGFSGSDRLERSASEAIAPDVRGTRVSSKETQETKFPAVSNNSINHVDSANHATKMDKTKLTANDRATELKSRLPSHSKMVSSEDVHAVKLGHRKSIRRATSSDILVTDDCKDCSSPSSTSSKWDSAINGAEEDLRIFKGKEARSFSFDSLGDPPQDSCNGMKKSMWRKVQQLRALKQSQTDKIILPYEQFVKLYSSDEQFYPFGLTNCGNSCYANSVLQCLAFTRPFTSYLVHGLHSKSCRKDKWCFICEFEGLIHKARQGKSPLSPIGILSKIQKFGIRLGHGTEEDAHEFLRFAVDTMQSICLKEAGGCGPLAEETTLVGLTFGGYLRSKIKCMRCLGKSERSERMMDLTVEIDGDIRTLEEALSQFTADEMLDGDNKYNCGRCKAYVKAKKKLTILEAPNILTIVLKRFQSGSFEKLNKSVQFPEALNITPYMSKREKSPWYSLYAVIVHRDHMNATSTGHYVCYVKNSHGEWFGINDSTFMHVQLERVLSEEAYMLLYERHSPRPPSSLKNSTVSNGVQSKKRNLEAVPSRKSYSNTSNMDSSKSQQKHEKSVDRIRSNDPSSYQLRDPYTWRYHAMQRIPHVDSSSESSSLFSCSDASSTSTKDSARSDDFSDYLFGDTGPGWYSHISSDSVEASLR